MVIQLTSDQANQALVRAIQKTEMERQQAEAQAQEEDISEALAEIPDLSEDKGPSELEILAQTARDLPEDVRRNLVTEILLQHYKLDVVQSEKPIVKQMAFDDFKKEAEKRVRVEAAYDEVRKEMDIWFKIFRFKGDIYYAHPKLPIGSYKKRQDNSPDTYSISENNKGKFDYFVLSHLLLSEKKYLKCYIDIENYEAYKIFNTAAIEALCYLSDSGCYYTLFQLYKNEKDLDEEKNKPKKSWLERQISKLPGRKKKQEVKVEDTTTKDNAGTREIPTWDSKYDFITKYNDKFKFNLSVAIETGYAVMETLENPILNVDNVDVKNNPNYVYQEINRIKKDHNEFMDLLVKIRDYVKENPIVT